MEYLSTSNLFVMYNINMTRKLENNSVPLKSIHENIGAKIALFRKATGYTQKELAENIGITQALISKYETEKLKLSAEILLKLAKALNVSADDLLGLNSKNKMNLDKLSLKVIRRLKKIEDLSVSKQKALFTTIDNFLKAEEK
jgi:transcriptional regulator with XRE-family HTH domain